MSGAAPEFSRPVPLARLGKQRLRQEIEASAEECAALARRLDLVSLGCLAAVVELTRQGDGTILLTASFSAEFEQSCVVTLDPVAGAVAETFTLRYGPPEWEPATGGDEDESAFEPLTGDRIDIGEAVAQEFALALPPFPRIAGTSIETELGAAAEPPQGRSPFVGLARFAAGGTK